LGFSELEDSLSEIYAHALASVCYSTQSRTRCTYVAGRKIANQPSGFGRRVLSSESNGEAHEAHIRSVTTRSERWLLKMVIKDGYYRDLSYRNEPYEEHEA
jgi:hypothetical protein